MRQYNPLEPLISLHVPKTGGTSLRLALQNWFRFGRLKLHYQGFVNLEPPDRHNFTGPICIHGHFDAMRGYGIDAYYPDARQFIVFLREPFERAVSLYYFIREFHLARPKAGRLFGSVGRRKPAPSAGDFMPFDRWIPFLAEERAAGRDVAYPWLFPAAPDVAAIKRSMADRFVFVGVTERYGASQSALAKALGKRPEPERCVNRTARAAEDLSYWRGLHEKTFAEEYELYAHALRLNEEGLRTFR